MYYLRVVLFYLFCSVFCPTSLFSQARPYAPATAATIPTPKTPADFFARARQLSDLEAAGIPFHMKATYVASGNAEFTGNGTYEEWWQSKVTWRKEATLGDSKYVLLVVDGKVVIHPTMEYVPLRLRQAMDYVLFQEDKSEDSLNWKLQHQKISGVELTLLSSSSCPPSKLKAECLNQDYFTDNGILRIRKNNALTTVYNNFQLFQNVLFPRNILFSDTNQPALNINVTTLERLNEKSTEIFQSKGNSQPGSIAFWVPDDDALRTLFPGNPQIQKFKDTKASLKHIVDPEYPMDARSRRIQGTVEVAATIDASGKIREPYVLISRGPSLDEAALRAVRQWQYHPVMIDGKPTAVNTELGIVFSIH